MPEENKSNLFSKINALRNFFGKQTADNKSNKNMISPDEAEHFFKESLKYFKKSDYGSALFCNVIAHGYFDSQGLKKGTEDCGIVYNRIMNSINDELLIKLNKEKIKFDVTSDKFFSLVIEYSPHYSRFEELCDYTLRFSEIVSDKSENGKRKYKEFLDNLNKEKKIRDDFNYFIDNLETLINYEPWKGNIGLDMDRIKNGLERLINLDPLGETSEWIEEIGQAIRNIEENL